MEDQSKQIDSLLNRFESYSKLSLELLKLKAVDKVAEGTSTLVAWIAVIAAVTLFFMILNVGIALWIGDLLGKSYLGFFVVAAFYALVGLLLFLFRNRWIKKPVSNSMINQMLN